MARREAHALPLLEVVGDGGHQAGDRESDHDADGHDDVLEGSDVESCGVFRHGLSLREAASEFPHQGTDRCVDEVGKKGACCKEPEVHGFITEGISYERNCRAEMPEDHLSTDQDGPTVDAAWRILLLNSDHLSGGEFQMTRSTGVPGEPTDNSTSACPAQIVVDLD